MTSTLDPATSFVRSLGGDYFMLREAAEMVGASSATLRRFIHETDPVYTRLVPSKQASFGKVKVYLYTREDIARLQEYFDRQREVRDFDGPAIRPSGRPRKYSPEQRKVRARLFTKANYWKKKADAAQADGDQEMYIEARQRLVEIETELSRGGN